MEFCYISYKVWGLGLKGLTQYVPRLCNKAADSLTHVAKFVGVRLWVDVVPKFIFELVAQEASFE